MIPIQTPTPKGLSHGIAPLPGKAREPLALRCKARDKDANPRRSRRILSKNHSNITFDRGFSLGAGENPLFRMPLIFSDAFDLQRPL